ncbi:MAG: 50S ribosomal protein L21 [Alphaproteobacteria bacterium]|nr:50S ribosomal protein L21 [Alphaproteobacteria bacterium]
MYAVIRTGGKQYRVAKDDVIFVEKLAADPGSSVTLDEVLMLGGEGQKPKAGVPLIAGASVTAQVLEQKLGDKVLVFKKRRRHNYRRKNGHRQAMTVLRITGIRAGQESAHGA